MDASIQYGGTAEWSNGALGPCRFPVISQGIQAFLAGRVNLLETCLVASIANWRLTMYDMRASLPAMVIWDGKCRFSLISAIRLPLYALYLYGAAHNSSLMLMISLYFERHSFIVSSFTSGGNPAILIFLVPLSANSMHTRDNSPLSSVFN